MLQKYSTLPSSMSEYICYNNTASSHHPSYTVSEGEKLFKSVSKFSTWQAAFLHLSGCYLVCPGPFCLLLVLG